MNKILPLALAALMVLPSCTTRIMDLTVTSSKNIDLTYKGGYEVKTNARTSGSDTSHIISFIPLGRPSIKEAMDRAIEKSGSQSVALSNMTLEATAWQIPLIYGQVTYTVEGDPIIKK